jgi:hypothetical protein
MLNTAPVASSFNICGPKRAETARPSNKYITIMEIPYTTASAIAFALLLFFFKKKLTVIGIIGHTQGVSSATNPPRKHIQNKYHMLCP